MMDQPHPTHPPADLRDVLWRVVPTAFWRVHRVLPAVPAARIAATALLLTLSSAHAQQPAPAPAASEPTPYQRAIAAGYKALTLCNGVFSAGRSPVQIDRDELAGIYPEYQAIVSTLPATVDRERWRVRVETTARLPDRIAVFDAETGCTLMPIGWVETIGPHGERTIYIGEASIPKASKAPWPEGDRAGPIRTPAAVREVVRSAIAGTYGNGTKTIGVVILQDSKIVAETYANGFGPFTPNRTWSVAKSIAGTLVGIAHGSTRERTLPATAGATEQREERARAAAEAVNPDAAATIDAWSGSGDLRRRITLDHLLRMASGLHIETAGNRTDAVYFGGAAVDQETTAWLPDAFPGSRFRYSNNDTLLAMLSLRTRLGPERYSHLPTAELFTPLGMRHTQAGTDWHGNYILSSQVWSTARDLARLGQFWLQDGVWQGKRLLPEGWMRYMTTPSGPQPASGPGYGATLWLFGPKQGLPEGSYAAQGNRGQYVMVIPSERLVIVRRGEDPGGARFDIARFSADVIAAVR